MLIGKYVKSGRKSPTPILLVRFVSASRGMLEEMADKLHKYANMKIKNVHKHSGAWKLDFSTRDGVRFYKFAYKACKGGIGVFLKRKKMIFEEYLSYIKARPQYNGPVV